MLIGSKTGLGYIPNQTVMIANGIKAISSLLFTSGRFLFSSFVTSVKETYNEYIEQKNTLQNLLEENKFLKEALHSLQELYDEDRKTIATLTEQLKLSQTEVEFMRRKYKLMWNKTVEEHAGK